MKREQLRRQFPSLTSRQAVLLESLHHARLAVRTAQDEATRDSMRRSVEVGLKLADQERIPFTLQNHVLHHAETVDLTQVV